MSLREDDRFGCQFFRRKIQTLIRKSSFCRAGHGCLHIVQTGSSMSAAGYHRNLQNIFQKRKINGNSPGCGLVTEIDTQNQRYGGIPHCIQAENLLQKPKSSFQAGGIAYGYNNLGFSGRQEMFRNPLFIGAGGERVDAGKIHKAVFLPQIRVGAFCGRHGNAGPVGRALVHSGQSIEDRAFSYIRISGQGDGDGGIDHEKPRAELCL